MKKVVSLVLALVMVLGMSTVAFAAGFTTTATAGTITINLTEGYSAYSQVHSITQNVDATDDGTGLQTNILTNPSGAVSVSAVAAGSTNSEPISLTVNIATGLTAATYTCTVEITPSASATASTGQIDVPVQIIVAPASATAPTITTTTLPNGVVSTAYSQTLAATGTTPITWALATGSSLPAGLSLNPTTGVISGTPTATGTTNFTVEATNSAGTDTQALSITVTATPAVPIPSGARITGVNKNYFAANSLDSVGRTGYADDQQRPDTSIKLKLVSDMFLWTYNGTENTAAAHGFGGRDVTENMLSRGKITVRKSISKGSNVIDKVEFDGTYITIDFVEYFVSTKSTDYDLTIYLEHDKSRVTETKYTITGTVENPSETVSDGDDYVSTEDGVVVEADDYIRNLEIYGGHGVSAFKNVFSGQKYYFVVTNELSSADDEVMNKYSTIENVLTVKQVNMNGATIKMNDMDDNYYVYNADGEYIGRSNETLPLSSKYYLSTTKIEMGAGDPDDNNGTTEPGDTSELPQDLGGNADVDNKYDNPGTGVNGLVSVAVLAGAVSLAGALVVSRKK